MRHIRLFRRASGKRSSQAREKNMAATGNTTDGSGVVAAVGGGGGGSGDAKLASSPVPDWTGDPVLLKEFSNKRKVPGFARVVKGSYMTIGSSKFSLQKQHHDIYIHSVKMGVKVLAHCLKRMEMPGPRRGQTYSRLCSTDQRLTVPISYQGWFELLSEDGKSARPIASVPELAKAFPSRCLVRENIKAYLSTGEGRLTFDKTKIITAGEQLKLIGELSLPAPSEGVKVKLLRCIDSKGDNVYLSFDQKGLFTPIAGEKDFTGVFSIRDIVRRFRLPLTVKLAQGVRPRVPDSKFSGLVRLDWVYTEETAFVCPLEKNHVRLLPVPTDVPLQLVAAANLDEIVNSEMFKSMQVKCTRMVNNYNNTLHLIVTVPDSVVKTQTRSSRSSNIFSAPLSPSESDVAAGGRVRRSKSREDLLMAEIDDLYGYVRDGGAPPITKFQYDSDEESYWEEPAYEPLDEFRARLKAMEAGQTVDFHAKYRPADPTQLKGLVGGGAGGGLPLQTVPAAALSRDPVPDRNNGVVSSASANSSGSDTTAVNDEPPPLPPRPPEMISTGPSSSNNSSGNSKPASISTTTTAVNNTTTTTSSNARPAADSSPLKTMDNLTTLHSRRVSAPSSPAAVLLSFNKDAPGNPAGKHTTAANNSKYVSSADVSLGAVKGASPRRVSRSDSEPSLTLPSSPTSGTAGGPSSAARGSATRRQASQGGGEETKPDWKERLRRFNAMQDKEGSSSTSSGSANEHQKKAMVAQRLARDFKDSDISSRTKASSGSSGGRGVRKRMQTLYL